MTTKIKSGVIGDNVVGITQLNVSDGTSGQVLTTDGSGTLSFADGGVAGISSSADATAITIDSSENVGIGATSPSEKLSILGGHVSVGDSTGVAGTEFLLEGYRELYNGAKYGNTSIRTTYDISSNASDMLFYTASGGTNTAERMRIDSTGAMTRPNHPCFDVTTSTASLTGTIAFNTVNIDNNSNYSTSNGRFTAPVAGSYMFYTQYIKQNS